MSDSGKLPISAFIIAQDEEDRIGRAVESVRDWAREVIVVDSGSKDRTREVAAGLGARVVENAWPGYGLQKRYAEDLCSNDWLFNLDADEEVTPELEQEFRRLYRDGEPDMDGFRVAILNIYPHETRPRKWGFGHNQIRLYDRRKGRFSDSPVHDTVRFPPGSRTVWLKSPMWHRPHRSLAASVDKLNYYSDAQLGDMRVRGRRLRNWRLLVEFPLNVLKAFFLRRYFLYGWWGWIVAVNYGFGRHLRLAKVYEASLLDAARAGKEKPPPKPSLNEE